MELKFLELELESELKFTKHSGIGIGIGIETSGIGIGIGIDIPELDPSLLIETPTCVTVIVSIDSRNDLMLNSIKPFLEPILTLQWGGIHSNHLSRKL